MTKKSTSKKPTKKTPIIEKNLAKIISDRRKEWRFEIPLEAIAKGKLPKGIKFKEKTTLENISSTGAYFCLDSGITVGSKINLVIDLPPKLTEGKKTKLSLGGLTVRLNKSDKKDKKQGIALCFDEEFQFISEE